MAGAVAGADGDSQKLTCGRPFTTEQGDAGDRTLAAVIASANAQAQQTSGARLVARADTNASQAVFMGLAGAVAAEQRDGQRFNAAIGAEDGQQVDAANLVQVQGGAQAQQIDDHQGRSSAAVGAGLECSQNHRALA